MAKFTKIIILFLSLLWSNNLLAKSPPPGTGTADVPANILIMLDNSYSMIAQLQASSPLYEPMDTRVDSSGNVYVLEFSNSRIKVFNSSGAYIRTIGGGPGTRCNQWQSARQFTIYNNHIYVADFYGHRIVVLTLTGGCVRQESTYSYPMGIAAGANYVYVSSYYQRISIHNSFSRGLGYIRNIYSYNFRLPWSLDLNSAGTKLLVSNYYDRVLEYSVSGSSLNFSRYIGGVGFSSRNGYYQYPVDAVYDSSGNIFTVEAFYRLQKFNSNGIYQGNYGGGIFRYGSPFGQPLGVSTDQAGNVYVADYYYNNKVYKFTNNLAFTMEFGGNRGGTRLDGAKSVIKKIVSDSELTKGANFGLMEWNTYPYMRVNVSSSGAKTIYSYVDRLYPTGGTYLDGAMNLAKNYFYGSSSPVNKNATCQQNFLIVISDGYWGNHSSVISIANSLRTGNPAVKTFAVGYAGGSGSNYEDLAKAGGTDSPLYATNEAELLQKLTDAIKQVISSTLTFTTPAVMSEVGRGDFVYQSTFEYARDKQWKGHLKKIPINLTTGALGNTVWDAADKLNAKSSTSRNLWTVGINATGLNNFTTSNRASLRERLFPTSNPSNAEVDKLINFIRGNDSYDEDKDRNTSESRHKLTDIYHSDLSIVGPPEASVTYDNIYQDAYYRNINNYASFQGGRACGVTCSSRKEILLAGSNGGMLHAFDTSNGEELWGFIPPSVLKKLSNMVSSKANSSNAIYAVDGSPIVKDIFYNNQWRTIVLTGLGAGGYSYFALDITNPTSPSHLFTVENDPFNKVVNFWDANGLLTRFGYRTGSIIPERDYRKLGEAWSTPRIVRLKVSGQDKWVAIFGAGFNSATNPEYGSAVYVMDLENEGKLLKAIDINDDIPRTARSIVWGTGSNNTQTTWSLASLGLSSYDSNIYTLKLSGSAGIGYNYTYNQSGTVLSNIRIIFDTPPPSNNIFRIDVVDKEDIVNAVPSDPTVITADSTSKANYHGAMVYVADLEGKVTKINLTDKGTLYDSTILFDTLATTSNGRYIYKNLEATINNDNNLWLYFGTGDVQKIQDQSSSILNRLYGIKDKDFPEFKTITSRGTVSQCKNMTSGGGACASSADLGWYIDLPKSQKLTAMPTVKKNAVYFPIYEPSISTNVCTTGTAILRALNSKCGTSLLNVSIGSGVLSKVVTAGEKIIVGISGEGKNTSGFVAKDNLLIANQVGQSETSGIKTETWKEN